MKDIAAERSSNALEAEEALTASIQALDNPHFGLIRTRRK